MFNRREPDKRFTVLHGDERPDAVGKEFKAYDAEDAAIRFAEYYDQDDHPLAEDESREELVIVTDSEGVKKQFNIRASISINYYADEVEPKTDADGN
jgi:hypothetical protein